MKTTNARRTVALLRRAAAAIENADETTARHTVGLAIRELDRRGRGCRRPSTLAPLAMKLAQDQARLEEIDPLGIVYAMDGSRRDW